MENSLNKEILDKVEEITQFIKDSSSYQNYLLLEDKMKSHPKIPKLIEEIKKLQKRAVQMESQGLEIDSIEKELSSLEEQLEEIPLYQDFIDTQKELNDSFSFIKESIEELFKF